ncbi:DivIVA domain-containing protein [Candidatus Aquiluna sp. UB-MaderosW2red]|uniref:DivIVA domain-containing protein n=1 Tax=Candidatus Aquiluna sp. UB-MaderosW2red TaxID=1855377 RepID=UPI000875DD04|nr:DivIVA domain-containing protein [Candidatus Aquiluna sp. UB-MaderosW2red]SCX12552.1 DivIVA domain-containing protein [Candidatus Aquiluna sp. UB-MaderosW2red]
MALTPEDVVNKRFTIVKFREGYDQDEVDDFLDEITKELRQMALENESLRGKLAASEALESEPVPSMPDFPVAPILAAAVPSAADASNSHSLLELARRLHEEHVREGLTKRDQLIRDGQENAARWVRDAESQARAVIGQLELDRRAIESTIDDLRDFEQDYRFRLRDYIETQLASLVREELIDQDPSQAVALVQEEIDLAARAATENDSDLDNTYSGNEQNELGERS